MSQINSIIQILSDSILSLHQKFNKAVKIPLGGAPGQILAKDQEGRVIWKNITAPAIVHTQSIKLGPCTNLGFYIGENNISLNWTDPADIILNDITLVEWNQTVLVKKEGSYPEHHLDGTVIASTHRNSATKNYYRDHSFIDTDIDSTKTYYYMLFSETVGGAWNALIENKFTNGTGLNWQQVGEFVEAGRGPELFPVGTVFTVDHPEYNTSTGLSGKIAFRVVGHDQVPAADETLHHTMCLDMCEILFNVGYDAAELEYALTEDTKTIATKTYYTYDGLTYTTLVEGTDYQIGDIIPEFTYYEKNLTDRHRFGSNNFEQSNLLQWANSDKVANQWFKKQTIFDTYISVLNNKNGFLKYIDSSFLSIVKEAKVITAKCAEEGSGSSINNAKFWPLSRTQINGSSTNGIMENERLSYFSSNSPIKTLNGISSIWWSRSISSNTYYMYHITADGYFSVSTASTVLGVSLACIVGKPNRMQYWKEVQQIVRRGKGPERFPVGTIFVVDHPEYTHQNGQGLIFRVVGHDQVPAADETLQHTMCLDMVDCLFVTPFDYNELEYAITEDSKTIGGKTYYIYNNSEFTALVEGIDYQIGDNIPVNTYYEKNLIGRNVCGNNNFKESNILQWANSDKSANLWFIKQNIWDMCTQSLYNKNGFLKYIDKEFLSVVQEAKLTNAKAIDEGGGIYTIHAKFWIPSRTQIKGEYNNGISENQQLSYYANGNSAIKQLNGVNVSWMFRTADISSNNICRYIQNDAVQGAFFAHDGNGISLACIIG